MTQVAVHEAPERLAIEFVEAMDRANEAAVVQQSFQELIERLGFAYVICTRLPPTQLIEPRNALMCTWPEEFTEAYDARGYAEHDPILREIVRSRHAVEWPKALEKRRLTSEEKVVLDHANRLGLRFGIAIPITEASGNAGFVNISGPNPCSDARVRSALTLVAIYVYHRLRALEVRRETKQRLSRREIEVLHWIAEGKSDWQIGQILSISAKTVNYHTENLKRKFGVATRMQAVVSAIKQGAFVPGEGLVLPRRSRENRNPARQD
jgi:LuxR family quorum sensing-dependent transcriptional regulator